ncbi:alpha-farnesene synthase-like [Solanum dulcamara]|uniref:alpha-farnesene synthase-like n=1 Tax=Solanum dulcamara TaxID=45834 RepID=UPI002484E518|nr:alpha-farnesene synthase-like [Solanum dulcamara]XP_055806519.1 alpha-farnesene synthase-like [Solanum dulcamara]
MDQSLIQRRNANYKPNIWKYDILQSLKSQYSEEKYKREVQKLKEEVLCLLAETVNPLTKLELIDSINKMSLSHLFDKEIMVSLQDMEYAKKKDSRTQMDLYSTALYFRIFRQYGYYVPQDVFLSYMDEMGEQFEVDPNMDPKTMMQLLEASHLALKDENILNEARIFCTSNLKSSNDTIPLHWMVEWYNTTRQISKEENEEKGSNLKFLQLAKLNFNMVQAEHQKDLVDILRWWRNLRLIEHVSFSRDRIVESFLWSVGVAFEPQHSNFRNWLTKAITFIIVIDDVYDIYGSLKHLQVFTDAVVRWDPKEVEQLPSCMQICFWKLYDTTNDVALEIQQQKGCKFPVSTYLQKVWAEFCKALLVEAKWDSKGHTPTFGEYLDNGWKSSGGTVLSLHILLGLAQDFSQVDDFLENEQDLIYYSSLIIRLCNDLGTSTAELERGDVSSSILCYMRKSNVKEDVARDHIKEMVMETWKKMNKHCLENSSPLIKYIMNMARVAHFIYQNGDGFGVQDKQTRKQILSSLIQPLPLN